MRLCLSIEIQEGLSYAETLALARTAEELGFDAVLLAEHYYPSGGGSLYAGGLGGTLAADAWMYLGALARDTSRIRLGTLVSPVTFRHPAVLAKMAATLGHVSGDRAELGMGAGWLESEHAAYGIPFGSPKERVDLLEEQLQIVRGLLHGAQPFSFSGSHYELRECWFTPQASAPHIIVGGRADSKRLLRLAAQFADEYVITLASVEQCRAVRERLTDAASGHEVRLALFTPACTAETEAQAEQLFERIVAEQPIMARMASSRDAWLIGSRSQVQSRLQDLEAAGVDRLMLPVLSETHREMLPLLVD